MYVLNPSPVGRRFPGKAGPGGEAVEFIGVVVGFGEPILVPHGIGDDAVKGAKPAALIPELRVLEGVALGGVPALAMAYLNEEVHPASAGQSAGTFIAGTVIGGLIGRLIAAPVGEWYHWRLGMGIVLALAVASAICFLWLTPTARKFEPTTTSLRNAVTSITTNLRSPVLIVMYLQGMMLMGGFVAVYNFLGFYLLEEPFSLPVSVVSLMFLTYLIGTVTSPWAGHLASKYGPARVLMALSAMIVVSVSLTLVPNIWVLLVF